MSKMLTSSSGGPEQASKTPQEIAMKELRDRIFYDNGGVGVVGDACLRLMEQGANVNGPANDGELLRSAIKLGKQNAIRVLLQLGADPNATGPVPQSRVLADPMSPLHVAVEMGSNLSCMLLLGAGADRFKKNRAGLTPIEFAAQKEDPDLVDALTFPLHTAVEGYPKVFVRLLRLGFSPLEKNADGKNVLEVAEPDGDPESIHLARAWVAQKEALGAIREITQKSTPSSSRKKHRGQHRAS